MSTCFLWENRIIFVLLNLVNWFYIYKKIHIIHIHTHIDTYIHKNIQTLGGMTMDFPLENSIQRLSDCFYQVSVQQHGWKRWRKYAMQTLQMTHAISLNV